LKGFLYGKTEYSIMNSLNRIDDYINYAKNNNFDYLSITDNNLFGAFKFYKKCKEMNIKPIIGIDLNFNYQNNNINVLIYPKNNLGYKEVVNLVTDYNYNKVLDLNVLDNIKDNNVIIFPFYDNLLEVLFNSNKLNELNDLLSYIYKIDSYIGISYTNRINNINLDLFIKHIENEYIKYIPIHKSLYLLKDDITAYSLLINTNIDNDFDYSFIINPKSSELLDNIINSINVDVFNNKIALPKFLDTKGMSSFKYLSELCMKGLIKRGFGNVLEYKDRLNYELNIIHNMGFDDYFLIVWDFIKYAKLNDILVGPGRGSACSSLVAYTLGIIEVDPVKNNLVFERFLNPERVSMPDIDTDFPDNKRELVINYVKNKYGINHVCGIVTFDRMKIKSAISFVSDKLKIDNKRIKRLNEAIDEYGYDYVLNYYKSDDEIYKLLLISKKFDNLITHTSTHPSGIIISNANLLDFIPMMKGSNDIFQATFESYELEELGLLKMDFLSLKYLSLLKEMMDSLNNFNAKSLRELNLCDPKVLKIYQDADTSGIFQFESPGMRDNLRLLHPTSFNDLVSLNALYRPGPMDEIPEFIKRKNENKFDCYHKDLEPILSESYGIIVYQEQVMAIAKKLSNFTLGEADLLRRAISKKNDDILNKLKDKFYTGAIKNGYSKELIDKIYDAISKFVKYGFNKAHSFGYTLLSYQIAWFKAYHLDIYMKVTLNNCNSNVLDRTKQIIYAKGKGLKIYPPNINISSDNYVINNGIIYLPLSAISNIGKNTVDNILKERNNNLFKSFDDFKLRVKGISNIELENLIFSGAFDQFNIKKIELVEKINDIQQVFMQFINKAGTKEEYDFNYLKEKEFNVLGYNFKYNLFINASELEKKFKAININKMKYNNYYNVIISFTDIKEIKTKNNDYMLVGKISDRFNEIKFVLFPEDYMMQNTKIEKDKLYLVNGQLRKDNKGETSFVINRITYI